MDMERKNFTPLGFGVNINCIACKMCILAR